jgi:hypothetical protein
VIAEILVAHLVGDYILQSHWMATEKLKRWWPAVAHGLMYTLPFIFITQSPLALLVIAGTHIVIDRYRLARHVSWLKNQIGPKRSRPEGHTATGYSVYTADYMSVWLMILTDNTMHILINIAAVKWF